MKYTADEILKMIDEMENGERIKLLYELYFKFYNKEGHDYIPLDDEY